LAAWITLFRPGARTAAGICTLVLMAAPATYLLAVLGSRGMSLEGYYWTRWIDPASLMLTVAFCLGYGAVVGLVVQPQQGLRLLRAGWRWAAGRGSPSGRAGRQPRKRSNSLRMRAAALRGRTAAVEEVESYSGRQVLGVRASGVALLLLLVLSLPAFSRSFADRRRHLGSDSRCIDLMDVGMAEWIRDHTPKRAVVTVSDAGALRYFAQRRIIDISGLNNSAIAFRKMSLRDVLAASDWLAIFPGWYKGSGILEEMTRSFEAQFEIRMPLKEYTICAAQGQTAMVAFRKVVRPSAPAAKDGPRP
jgi:hypothetical protein